jgi:hypothetical protein
MSSLPAESLETSIAKVASVVEVAVVEILYPADTDSR